MTESLAEWLFGYLVSRNASDDTVDLALAAMVSGAAVDEVLAGRAASTRPDTGSAAVKEPAGAFIRSLTVQGFRGVGPAVKVNFQPGPGLIIIAGRNGSGKSSLAEALEVTLTRNTFRWRNAQFAAQWRNLHQSEPAQIKVELAQEDVGSAVIKAEWSPGESDAGAVRVTYQRAGVKQEDGLHSLGWSAALEMYRPILSYEQLGSILAGRSIDLHRALAKVLGLEEVEEAGRRIAERLSALRAAIRESNGARKDLRVDLLCCNDDRAAQAAVLLQKREPDLDLLTALATGEVSTAHSRDLADAIG